MTREVDGELCQVNPAHGTRKWASNGGCVECYYARRRYDRIMEQGRQSAELDAAEQRRKSAGAPPPRRPG
jgi:hypothetical protein